MKQNMIRHFLNLYKNGGRVFRAALDENNIALCDGYLFFIQDRSEMLLNEKIFKELIYETEEKNIFLKFINGENYEEARIACYLPTYRKNKYNTLLKSKNIKVILNKYFLDLFDYEKLEIKSDAEIVKVYDSKGKLLGGILPMKCEPSMYEI